MKVVEIFTSIDGEGVRAGELTTFIRLYGCNLHCSYCDTRYACEQTEENLPYNEMAIEDIVEQCKKECTRNITLTGGEPLIHKDTKYLLRALSDEGFDVNVETNGSVDIKNFMFSNVWFTVDYKCNTSGMSNKMCKSNFENSDNNVVYKFVVGSIKDLEQAKEIIDNILDSNSSARAIYLSPVFGDIEPAEIVDFMYNNNLFDSYTPIRVQLQLHKYIWNPKMRGV